MFAANQQRFATYDVIAKLPGEMIDEFWFIIDQYLQGVLPMDDTLTFRLSSQKGHVSYDYLYNNQMIARFDTQFAFQSEFPEYVMVYDDGDNQTVLLPDGNHQ
jgi:hypothetical protein